MVYFTYACLPGAVGHDGDCEEEKVDQEQSQEKVEEEDGQDFPDSALS